MHVYGIAFEIIRLKTTNQNATKTTKLVCGLQKHSTTKPDAIFCIVIILVGRTDGTGQTVDDHCD